MEDVEFAGSLFEAPPYGSWYGGNAWNCSIGSHVQQCERVGGSDTQLVDNSRPTVPVYHATCGTVHGNSSYVSSEYVEGVECCCGGGGEARCINNGFRLHVVCRYAEENVVLSEGAPLASAVVGGELAVIESEEVVPEWPEPPASSIHVPVG